MMTPSTCQPPEQEQPPALDWPAAEAPLVCLFGGGFDTANLGVAALTEAVLVGVHQRLPEARFVVFDHSRGAAQQRLDHATASLSYERRGARWSRRFYASDTLTNLHWSARLGGLSNRGARQLRRAAVVLDISGGDSFTDLYGQWRYRQVCLPKRLAIDLGVPLVLLPQTYGPFGTAEAEHAARQIVRSAHTAWARDERSFEQVRSLLGDAFDAQRHHLGVDVAFGLEPRRPEQLDDDLADWLADRQSPLVGLNISGLIYNDPATASRRFGFKADYREVVHRFMRRLLQETDARLLLVPHVLTPSGHFESDAQAAVAAAEAVGSDAARVQCGFVPASAPQAKWMIGQCDWFVGTRMHATIAALSSGVPAAAVTYSDKTLGVFETCDQGEKVIDPRTLDTEAVVDRLWQAWLHREAARQRLANALPAVKQQARSQMDMIAQLCVDRVSPRPAQAGSGA